MLTNPDIEVTDSSERIHCDARRPLLRVLLMAEACNPEWTSVPLLAYHWYRALRQRADVVLVTQVRNREGFCRNGKPEDAKP